MGGEGVVSVYLFTAEVFGEPPAVYLDYGDAKAHIDGYPMLPRRVWRARHADDGFSERVSRQLVACFKGDASLFGEAPFYW